MSRSIARPLATLLPTTILALGLALFGVAPAMAASVQGVAIGASCSGPNNGSVAPGQTDQCSVSLTSGTVAAGSTIRIAPTSPSGAVAACFGATAVAGANGCVFNVPNGIAAPHGLGTENVTIPSSTASGTLVRENASICDSAGGCQGSVAVGVTGSGAQVTGSGQGGGPGGCQGPAVCSPPPPPPTRQMPTAPYVAKFCRGPNPNLSVSPGQTATCAVTAETQAPYIVADEVKVFPTFSASTTSLVTGCTGVVGAPYTTTASLTSNRCDFTVTSGQVIASQLLGYETVTIPTSTAPGTPLSQAVIFCFGVFTEGACTAQPATAIVTGPAGIITGNQTIDFSPIPTHTFGDASFPLVASATSGLPVAFSAGGPCTASGSMLTITGGGVCTITATQPGDLSYNPAPPVTQSFNIDCLPSVIPFGVAGPTTGSPVVIADLLASDLHNGANGGCGGTFTAQLALPPPLSPLPVAGGTFTASTSGTVATAVLTGATLTNPAFPFTATVTLDVVSHQGTVSETFSREDGPVIIVVSFAQMGGAYVVTGMTGT